MIQVADVGIGISGQEGMQVSADRAPRTVHVTCPSEGGIPISRAIVTTCLFSLKYVAHLDRQNIYICRPQRLCDL